MSNPKTQFERGPEPGPRGGRSSSVIETEGSLRIGDLAARTGVTVEALRYYERRGLLQPSGRRESGYREYPPGAVRLVHFIKRAQSLGFTLTEVEELVHLREQAWAGNATSLLREATVTKVHDIDRRMRELGALRDELNALITACDAACPVTPEPVGGGAVGSAPCGPDADNTPSSPLDCPLVDALDSERLDHGTRTTSFAREEWTERPAGVGTAEKAKRITPANISPTRRTQ